jgi:two-component system phosphate regulon response regulator PhoB
MKEKESILILEKDRLLRCLYKEELEDEGYITIFAADDKDVFQKINEFSPDLFITNYQIPSTESFAAMLHKTSEKEHIPIIINTAYPREMIDAASFEVAEYITKTADLKMLKEVAEYITKTADLKMLKNKINVLLHSRNA